jgi:hypothetical protein
MELLSKLRDLFRSKPELVTSAPLCSDEEFLEFIAAQTRNRTLAEQAAQPKPAGPAAPLSKVA